MPPTTLHVALVYPEIPWNTGNAGRTCLAAGAQLHLIRPLGFRLEDRFLRRAGLDYWPRVEPVVWPDWEAFEAALPELGTPFLLTPEAPRCLWQVTFPEQTVLILGREGSGLPAELRNRYAGACVSIPIADPGLRSLNLSTTVGIAVYEVLRQRTAACAGPGVAQEVL